MRSDDGRTIVAKRLHLDGLSAIDLRRLETEVRLMPMPMPMPTPTPTPTRPRAHADMPTPTASLRLRRLRAPPGCRPVGICAEHLRRHLPLHLRQADPASPPAVRQVSICAKLRHPNICHYLGTVSRDGMLQICLEHAAGGTLSDRIDETAADGRRFACDVAASWIAQIASAVAYMHSSRVLHRDLSAKNVFLSRHGDGCDVKVGDFGLSHTSLDSLSLPLEIGRAHV